MLRLNVSENFEHWADAQLTSPSPEEILSLIEEYDPFDTLENEEFTVLVEILSH